jgi:hypothetical protein
MSASRTRRKRPGRELHPTQPFAAAETVTVSTPLKRARHEQPHVQLSDRQRGSELAGRQAAGGVTRPKSAAAIPPEVAELTLEVFLPADAARTAYLAQTAGVCREYIRCSHKAETPLLRLRHKQLD